MSGHCRVSIPESAESFFGRYDNETLQLNTCTGEKILGYYTELYNYYNRVPHTKSCADFNAKSAESSMRLERPGDCTIV